MYTKPAGAPHGIVRAQWTRHVLDDFGALNGKHTGSIHQIVCADIDGDGDDEQEDEDDQVSDDSDDDLIFVIGNNAPGAAKEPPTVLPPAGTERMISELGQILAAGGADLEDSLFVPDDPDTTIDAGSLWQ